MCTSKIFLLYNNNPRSQVQFLVLFCRWTILPKIRHWKVIQRGFDPEAFPLDSLPLTTVLCYLTVETGHSTIWANGNSSIEFNDFACNSDIGLIFVKSLWWTTNYKLCLCYKIIFIDSIISKTIEKDLLPK